MVLVVLFFCSKKLIILMFIEYLLGGCLEILLQLRLLVEGRGWTGIAIVWVFGRSGQVFGWSQHQPECYGGSKSTSIKILLACSSPRSHQLTRITGINYVLIILDLKLHTWGFEIWVGTNIPVNCIMSIFGSSIFSFSASKKYPDFCSCSAGESVFAWLWFEIWVGNWAQICSPLNATRMSSSQLSSLEKCAAKSSKLLQISRANK